MRRSFKITDEEIKFLQGIKRKYYVTDLIEYFEKAQWALMQQAVESLFDEDDFKRFCEEEDRKEMQGIDIEGVQRKFIKVNRDEMNKLLPYHWNDEIANDVMKHFKGCALTGEKTNIVFDHFIPVSWGHGGTYKGNVIPLSKELNLSKDNQNPFEWIKKREVQKKVDKKKWRALIEYLADLHGLTPDGYKEYVYWCSKHRRNGSNPIEFSSLWTWKMQNS